MERSVQKERHQRQNQRASSSLHAQFEREVVRARHSLGGVMVSTSQSYPGTKKQWRHSAIEDAAKLRKVLTPENLCVCFEIQFSAFSGSVYWRLDLDDANSASFRAELESCKSIAELFRLLGKTQDLQMNSTSWSRESNFGKTIECGKLVRDSSWVWTMTLSFAMHDQATWETISFLQRPCVCFEQQNSAWIVFWGHRQNLESRSRFYSLDSRSGSDLVADSRPELTRLESRIDRLSVCVRSTCWPGHALWFWTGRRGLIKIK